MGSGLLAVIDRFLGMCPKSFVVLKRLNNDRLEGYFSQVKYHSRGHPTVAEYRMAAAFLAAKTRPELAHFRPSRVAHPAARVVEATPNRDEVRDDCVAPIISLISIAQSFPQTGNSAASMAASPGSVMSVGGQCRPLFRTPPRAASARSQRCAASSRPSSTTSPARTRPPSGWWSKRKRWMAAESSVRICCART